MNPVRALTSPWTWVAIVGVLLIVLGFTGRLAVALAALLVPDALQPDLSEGEGQ